MLEREFQYYLDNQEKLVNLYKGKFIVIKGEEVIGSYNSQKEAYDTTIKTEKLGTFLIQQCLPEASTQTFHSRVIIHSLK